MLFDVKYLVMFVTLFLFSRMTYPKNRLRHVEKMSISENIENAGYGLFIFSTSVLLLLFACIYGAYNFALNKLTIFRDEEQYTYFPISLERSSVLETHSWPLYVNRLRSSYAQTHFLKTDAISYGLYLHQVLVRQVCVCGSVVAWIPLMCSLAPCRQGLCWSQDHASLPVALQ